MARARAFARRGDALITQRNNLANHHPRKVWIVAESGIADDVEVRKARQTDCVTQSVAAGAFGIEKYLGGVSELVTEEERVNPGRRVLGARTEAMCAAILSREASGSTAK